MFFKSRMESKKAIAKELQGPSAKVQLELNLDTLQEYLKSRFPDRNPGDPEAISLLLRELKDLGYRNIEEIDAMRERLLSAALEVEKDAAGDSEQKFHANGLIRVLLDLGHEAYRKPRVGLVNGASYWDSVKRHASK